MYVWHCYVMFTVCKDIRPINLTYTVAYAPAVKVFMRRLRLLLERVAGSRTVLLYVVSEKYTINIWILVLSNNQGYKTTLTSL